MFPAVLAYYHGNGNKDNDTVAFEYREIKQALAFEFQHKKSSSYLDFFKTPGNRYRVVLLVSLAMISQYSGSNLFSNYANKIYANAGITGQERKLLVGVLGPNQPRGSVLFAHVLTPGDLSSAVAKPCSPSSSR